MFFVYKFRNSENYFRYTLISFLIILLSFGILISGNRMPVILFLLGIFLIYIFNKKLRKIALANFVIFFLVLGTLISTDNYWKTSYTSFFQRAVLTVTSLYQRAISDKTETLLKERKELAEDKVEVGRHRVIFYTAI